ncbi:DUF7282 domain-containing protein [Haloarchaeobius sp. TZWWS8]|uniref:DUF7282 domain-containing protein n=1 Tax=Haloarchaeobius sp. TZWWS8 TaxID=3446121 RepID=UPI003EBD95AA
MRRPPALLVAILVVVATLPAAYPVAAHGNHLSADAQLSADGTIVVESLFTMGGGHLVVHENQGGSPGRALGSVAIERGYHTTVGVTIDDEFWRKQSGNESYWLVLHSDDGDGEFEEGTDEPLRGIVGGYAGQTVTVRKSDDGSTRVLTSGFTDQKVDSASVSIRRVDAAESSYVVLHEVTENGSRGPVVGTTSVQPGHHEDVRVSLQSDFFTAVNAGETFSLEAVIYQKNGDGEFGAPPDEPVRVGDELVSSRFRAKKVEDARATTESLINTPEPTTGTASSGSTTDSATAPSGAGDGGRSEGSLPGFTATAAFAGFLGSFAIWRARRD